jgi:hypothetical protein
LKFRVRFFAFFILIGSFLPNSDLHELSKISFLIQHYQGHQDKSQGQLSFLEFLKMHYRDARHMKSENHERLPLKQMGNSPFDYFVSTPLIQCAPQAPHFPEPREYVLFDQVVPDQSGSSIWQPPKLG